MPTARTLKGFDLSCPRCGAKSAITIDLNDLVGDLSCEDCSDTFTIAQAVRETAETAIKWAAVQRWVASAGNFADQES